MKKDLLDRKFIHHAWFKEGVTKRYALDNFAKNSSVYLSRKKSRKQSDELFADIVYDVILTDGYYSYKICEEEIQYFLERKEYWDKQKEIEKQQWLNSEVNIEKELEIYLGSNSNYDIDSAEYQLSCCLSKRKDDIESIEFWKNEINERKRKHDIIDNIVAEHKHNIKTNRDFIELTDKIKQVI